MVARMRHNTPTKTSAGTSGNGDVVLMEASSGTNPNSPQSARITSKRKSSRGSAQVAIWWVLLVLGGLGNWMLWKHRYGPHDGSPIGASWARMAGIVPSSPTTTSETTISLADPNHFAKFTKGKSGSGVGNSEVSTTAISKPIENSIRDDVSIKKSFSFCLILKDDNDILNEWIAYHYYTLHMRTLIVTIDPSSKTTPVPLLEVWKHEFGLNYEIWNDSNFTEPWFYAEKDYDQIPRQVKWEDKDAAKWQEEGADVSYEQRMKDIRAISIHRYRQKRFLHRCEQYLQEEGYSWMTHIDTDEYIVVSPTIRKRKRTKQKKVLLNESDTIYHFLEEVKTNELVNYPCISLPRVLYGSVEESDSPPTFFLFEAKQMESLRWKYRTSYDNDALNKQPKVIMDVSGFPPIEEYYKYQKTFSIHRPDFALCRAQGQMNVKDGQRFPFTINHYLGSLERYMARNDTRRTQTQYNQKANLRDGKDGAWIDPWWPGFLKKHGKDKAFKVLGRYMDPNVYGAEAKAAIVQREQATYTPPTFDSPDEAESEAQKSLAETQSGGGRVKPPKLGISLPLEEDSFSVCMLIKDDNDILNEWIAYHYHTLKLRYLVVATDPSSQTSPSVVLDRWKDRIEIEDWDDSSYMPDYFVQGEYGSVPNMLGLGNSSTARNTMNLTEALEFHGVTDPQEREEQTQVNNHRFRQMNFFESCIRDLMQKNKTWMAHIDTDEYITLNHLVKQQSQWRKMPVPSLETPASLLDFLKKAATNHKSGMSYPCISMPRLLYGSKQDEVQASTIHNTFDSSKFETLKWKYHSDYDNAIEVNGRPKVILDLSGIPPKSKFLEHTVWSIHRPGLRMCRPDREVRFDDKVRFPFIVQHYLGSWERYSHRSDARRSREKYDSKNEETTIEDNDWIDSWVEHFANAEGIENATRLLAEYTI